ncbi:MAG: carbohydrate-binding domain-containing protein [Lachnospiraceae bacterium]|nr:carbohydrate-binding domain-containing protein [Lachnospiraceae bacterium]
MSDWLFGYLNRKNTGRRLLVACIIAAMLMPQAALAAEDTEDMELSSDVLVEEVQAGTEEAAEDDGPDTVSADSEHPTGETAGEEIVHEALSDGDTGSGSIAFSISENGQTKTISDNCYGISIDKDEAGDYTKLTISKKGSYTLSGHGKNVYMEIAEGLSDVSIILSYLTFDDSGLYTALGSDVSVISGNKAEFTLSMVGESKITGPASYKDDPAELIGAGSGKAVFAGSGSLSLSAEGSAISAKKGTVAFKGGIVTVLSSGDDAVKAKDGTVSIEGGTLDIEGTAGDGIKVKGGNANISSGSLIIKECFGDGIQAENVSISGGTTEITTVSNNAATGYYTGGSTSAVLNTLSESGDTKTERINIDTGSHKGIKAGTKAATKKYKDTVSVDTIEASGGIEISGGTIKIDTTGAGLKANRVAGGDYTATQSGKYIIGSPDDGIQSNKDMTITGGSIEIASGDDGIGAAGKLTISNNAAVKVTTAFEGLEAADIVIGGTGTGNSPTIELNTNDDGINAASKTVVYTYDNYGYEDNNYTKVSTSTNDNTCVIYSGNVTINIDSNDVEGNNTVKLRNGSSDSFKTVSCSASGDGIDCNGSLDIEGGRVYVFGQSSGDNSPLDQEKGFTLGSSATVFATGAAGMAGENIPTSGNGIYLTAGSVSGGPGGGGNPGEGGGPGASDAQKFSAGNTLTITSGNTGVFTCELPYDAEFVLYASPDLVRDRNYTVSDGSYSANARATTPSGGEQPTDIRVTGIILNMSDVTLANGDTLKLTAIVEPSYAKDTSVSWKTSNRNVVTVAADGTITGTGVGEASVTATTNSTSESGRHLYATCHVNVTAAGSKDPSVTPTGSGQDGVVIPEADPSPSSAIRDVAEKANYFKVEMVNGQKHTFGKGTWKSYNPKIVTVNKKSGAAVAKKRGTAYVTNTYKTSNGYITEVYTIAVHEPSLSLKALTLLPGDTATVTVRDTGAMDVSWLSSNNPVASVSGNKNAAEGTSVAVITAVGKGSAKIKAYVGGKSYPVSITVKDQAVSGKLSENSAIRLNAYQTYTLKYDSSVFKPSKVIEWADASGNEWEQDRKGNWTNWTDPDEAGALTITKAGKVIGNAVTKKPVYAYGTDSDGNTVRLGITVDAIPTKTDIYLNVGQTVSFKHSYLKGNVYKKWDDNCISIPKNYKPTIKITGVYTGTAKAGEATLTCNNKYITHVHVEDPSLTLKGNLNRLDPNKFDYTLRLDRSEGESFEIEQRYVAQAVNWKSSNKSKVFVSEDGVIYARGRGSATVSGKVNNKTVKIKVKVE